ncbi:MAG: sigma-54-dependent Fis family transcriptional regulator [Candidatus Dadabacteria bacterium]|nr:MAG: sigma-54-dependent Fis family transcriptional regulator [Candidatus Dadabacteria bacterium]
MEKLLIVEDADSLRDVLSAVLQAKGYSVDAVSSAEEALNCFKENQYDCILADFKLPGMNGIELLTEFRKNNTRTPYIIMTAFGSIDIAVAAMKEGANDFLTKPFEPQVLCTVIKEVISHKRIIDRNLGTRTKRERSFLTENPATQRVLKHAKKAAAFDSSVMILGESGTGKELIARYIHDHSPRAGQPFVAVNCAAMPSELLESEFFGHEAGAFTGATQTRVGVLELASEGTIFLDEIGDMPAALQVKLLRALQEREIKRVGGVKTIKVNPRIISATNVKVEEAIRDKKLREDFYYRLAVITLEIPPLRERKQDIDLLADYYINYFCNVTGKHGLKLDSDAREIMRSYHWPGNARELENVIERAVILAEDTIRLEHLGINLSFDFDAIQETACTLPEIAGRAARKAEREAIRKILNQTMGNKTKAAEILGVSYKTLLNKVKEYQIQV